MAWLEKRGGSWWIAWREGKQMRRENASTDRQVAKAKLGEFQTRQLRGEKFSDPYREHRKRPIAEHVAEYLADLRTLGRDSMYVYNISTRLKKLLDGCGWKVLGDITADSFCRWRDKAATTCKKQPKNTIGPRTKNQYREVLRTFCSWCVKRRRMESNPMAFVEQIDQTGDVRRERRALTAEEVAKLLAVESMSAEHRRFYRLILATGLRRQEAADLIWFDVHADCTTPYLALRAKATKARRADSLPLRVDVAQELHDARGGAGDSERVFKSIPTMDEHRSYLAAAKIDWEDEHGRRVDIHAMRHTYGTLLSKSGVSPREAMSLMRHSDLRLTMNVYTDPKIFDLAGAVTKLPLPVYEPKRETVKATGTDGNSEVASRVANRVASHTAERLRMTPDGSPANSGNGENLPEKQGDWPRSAPVDHALAEQATLASNPSTPARLSLGKQKISLPTGSKPGSKAHGRAEASAAQIARDVAACRELSEGCRAAILLLLGADSRTGGATGDRRVTGNTGTGRVVSLGPTHAGSATGKTVGSAHRVTARSRRALR